MKQSFKQCLHILFASITAFFVCVSIILAIVVGIKNNDENCAACQFGDFLNMINFISAAIALLWIIVSLVMPFILVALCDWIFDFNCYVSVH